jgi:hypothetical protein
MIAALMASAIVAPAQAETLRDALSAAYETNPTLTGARAGQRATNESVPLARANGRPDATGTATYTELFPRSDGNNFTPDRTLSGGINVSVPIYTGGAVKNSIRAAENRVQAGFAGLRATESAIFSAVVATYMDVIRDEAIVDLNRAQVGVLQVNLEATRDRFQIGDLTRTDVAQSEARLALATSNLEAARANLIRSKENYIQLVGHVPGDLEAPPPLPNFPATPEEAVGVALEYNPDLIAAKELVAVAMPIILALSIQVPATGRSTKVRHQPKSACALPYHCIRVDNPPHKSGRHRPGWGRQWNNRSPPSAKQLRRRARPMPAGVRRRMLLRRPSAPYPLTNCHWRAFAPKTASVIARS